MVYINKITTRFDETEFVFFTHGEYRTPLCIMNIHSLQRELKKLGYDLVKIEDKGA